LNSEIREARDRILTVEDLRFDSPELPVNLLQEFAAAHFAVTGRFESLLGERDQNFCITSDDGRRYVLKVSGQGEPRGVVDFQVRALLHIEQKNADLPVPRLVPGTDGEYVQILRSGGGDHVVRLLTFLPGLPYDDGPAPSPAGLHRAGKFLARLALALHGFQHPSARDFMPWDICNGLIFNHQLQSMLPRPVLDLIRPALARLEGEVYPRLPSLRRQVIHHDGHGGNLLRESAASEGIAGVIDFGDMIEAPLICDLAVALASFLLEQDDPQAVFVAICQAYDSVTPLTADETDLLLDLTIARLILTFLLFRFRQATEDNVPDFVITEQPAMIAVLEQLTSLDRTMFNASLREACSSDQNP